MVSLFWALVIALLAAENMPMGCEAFCNCLAPMGGMFKMGKHGQLSPYAPVLANSIYGPQVAHPGERASWYPQTQQQLAANYAGQSPIKRFNLFQPRWRGSLLGPKKWMMDWRMMGANSNFYRPGYGYGWQAGAPPQISPPPQAQLLPASIGTYQYGDTSQPQQYSGANTYQGTKGAYSPQLNQGNDGWTAVPSSNIQLPPYNNQQQQQQQQLYNYGDSYGVLPNQGNYNQSSKQQQQPGTSNSNYGTKGANGSKQQSYNTTRKPRY